MVDQRELVEPQRRGAFIGRVVRRWIWVSVAMVALFAITTSLQAIWSPLAWVVPIGATGLLVVLLGLALSGRRFRADT